MKKRLYNESYKELKLIGRGSFGTANLVESQDTKDIFVAKKVVLGNLTQKEVESAQLEVKLLRELKHPHIVEYKECFIEEELLITIMEYCEEGDLKDLITKQAEKNEFLDEKIILNWFLQVLLALEFIHQKKILHRDIKTSNIFLKSDGTVKIGDFGIAKSLENTNEKALTVIGTPYYMSPEVCENKPYTYKSDVWALGCVLYEMCALRNAFTAKNLLGLIYKIVRDDFDPLPQDVSSEMTDLIRKLLTKDENKRPGILEIIETDYIQKACVQVFSNDDNLNIIKKIPLKPSLEKTQILSSIDKENQEDPTKEKTEEKNVEAIANESLKVMDLLEDSAYYPQNQKKFPLKSNSENMLGKIDNSKQIDKNMQPCDEVQLEIIESENNENDFISYQLPETEVTEKPLRSNFQVNTFFQKSNKFGIKIESPNSLRSTQSCNHDLYEKKLRQIQRMIPRRPYQSIEQNDKEAIISSPVGLLEPKQTLIPKESNINNISTKYEEMERDLFDVTKESLEMSLAQTEHGTQNQGQNNLSGTCTSENLDSQLKPADNEKTINEEVTQKNECSNIQEKTLEDLSFSLTLTSTLQIQNSIKSSLISKTKNKQSDSDYYEEAYEEYEEDYEEDFEEYDELEN